MITLYLHKFHDGEVVAYADPLSMKRVAKWSKDISKPTRRNKYVTVNCFKYLVEWI